MLPKKTVYDIAYAMQAIDERRRNIKKRVMEVWILSVETQGPLIPDNCRWGQPAVAIARAIVNNPESLDCGWANGELDPDTMGNHESLAD